jgi:hypothetical protein
MYRVKLTMKDGTTSVITPPQARSKASALRWARLLRQSKRVARVLVFKAAGPAGDHDPRPAA